MKPVTPRGQIYDNVADTIGATPLVRLPHLTRGFAADLCYKLEFFNPGGSVKDRIALSMVESLENSGALKPGGTIIEPTSGNTGIGLAFIAAVKGYKSILVMPEQMSIERRKLMRHYGAQLVLTEAAKGMTGAIDKAAEIAAETPGGVLAGQFVNPANPDVHYRTTGPEIWKDTGGSVDVLISGVGTGGTLTGAGRYLKEKNPDITIIALEPTGSPVLSQQTKGPHKIQGIGAGFVPEVLDVSLIDEVITVQDEDAFATAREVARTDGLAAGISGGAAIWASLDYAGRVGGAPRIVTIIASNAERYLTTALFEDQ